MTIKTVPIHYSVLWIQTAMKITERYYGLFLGATGILATVAWASGFIPMIGGICSSILSFLFAMGSFRVTQRIFNGDNVTFDTFLQETFNSKMFMELLPMIVVACATGATNTFMMVRMSLAFQGLLGFVFVMAYVVSLYAGYIKLNSSLNWQSCYAKALEGLWQNIIPLICAGFIVCFFLIGCLILCIVPFFAYGLPVMFPWGFLVFNCIYGEMDLDATYKVWSQKIQAPPPTNTTTF